MKRITPEKVLAAYVATGLKPEQKHPNVRGGACCAIGALCRDGGLPRTYRVFEREYGHDYLWAFIHGFDGNKSAYTDSSPEGYADGLAAWDAVKHLAEAAQ